jgi:hypothetical protein
MPSTELECSPIGLLRGRRTEGATTLETLRANCAETAFSSRSMRLTPVSCHTSWLLWSASRSDADPQQCSLPGPAASLEEGVRPSMDFRVTICASTTRARSRSGGVR